MSIRTKRVVARVGMSPEIPVLVIGELGWDVDKKRARMGDGTTTPPIIMTHKSIGPFEYNFISYVQYPEIRMLPEGTVDGVDISDLNAANGILVRRGNNLWAHRTIVGANGGEYISVVNGNGVSGNPTLDFSAEFKVEISEFLKFVYTDNLTILGDGRQTSPLYAVTATTSRKGVAELATSAETITGTDTERTITPAGLSARTATTSRTGIVELGTQAEVDAGTGDVVVTAETLHLRTATTTRRGIVELATNAETQTGTDDERAITPAALSSRTATTTRTGIARFGTQTEINEDTANVMVSGATLGGRTAREDRTGILALATAAEVLAGTNEYKAITPATLVQRVATTSRTGLVELGTQTEVNAGTGDVVVTAATLHARTATTTRAGIVELATNAETTDGSDATRAITPAGLDQRTSTETKTGITEIANLAETLAGVDDFRYITPFKLKKWGEENLDADLYTFSMITDYGPFRSPNERTFDSDLFTYPYFGVVTSTGDITVNDILYEQSDGYAVGIGGDNNAQVRINRWGAVLFTIKKGSICVPRLVSTSGFSGRSDYQLEYNSAVPGPTRPPGGYAGFLSYTFGNSVTFRSGPLPTLRRMNSVGSTFDIVCYSRNNYNEPTMGGYVGRFLKKPV